MQSVFLDPLTASSQLSSAASLNLGRSQNGLSGNGLTHQKQIPLKDNVGNEGKYRFCFN